MILEVEQYKAAVEQPKGKDEVLERNEFDNKEGITDDQFFHLTCHLEEGLKTKIEKGEFVELEKLFPRDRYGKGDGRMELVNREGCSYFVPYQRDMKITNIRKWEQAFSVYVAVYSAANPSRSAEIWQYVYVINSAAAIYIWDDVAHYNFVFRQLMSANPKRSWAKTYTQMWQMTMRTHIPSRNSSNFRGNSHSNTNQSEHKHTRKFNKGWCTDPQCQFPQQCNYCDGKHGMHTCFNPYHANCNYCAFAMFAPNWHK